MANWDTIVCWVHQLINEIDLFCQVNNERVFKYDLDAILGIDDKAAKLFSPRGKNKCFAFVPLSIDAVSSGDNGRFELIHSRVEGIIPCS